MFSGRFWEELVSRFPEIDEAELKQMVRWRLFFLAGWYVVQGMMVWFMLEKIHPGYFAGFAMMVFVFVYLGIWFWNERRTARRLPGFEKKLKGTLLRRTEWTLSILAGGMLLMAWLHLFFSE